MTEVFVVCAAGASSTFLARRLSDLSAAAGHMLNFTPSSVSSISDNSTAVVAVTSHVATPEVLDTFTSTGISHVVLPSTVRGGFGAEDALSEILSFVGDNDSLAGSIVEAHRAEGTN